MIDADEDKLKQVFFNLIRNAIEASKKGKKIRVVTRISNEFVQKSFHNQNLGMNIVIEIIDNGMGIPEENQKKLFAPFYTTKNKGNGLGLPISLKIVEDHFGKIKIYPQKSGGTSVQVFLPIRQRKPPN